MKMHVVKKLGSVLLTVALALAACGGDDGDSAATTSTAKATSTSSTSTTATTEPDQDFTAEEQEVIDAYLEYFHTRVDALNPPNPADPRLADIATGDGLEALVLQLEERQADGVGVRPADDSRYGHVIEEVVLEGDTAKITSCELDDNVVYNVASGDTINDEAIYARFQSDLRRVSGSWKVLALVGIEELPEGTTC